MKKEDKYSITSNIPKLLKHLDNLKSLQKGIPKPILLHLMPTNQCNLKCENCCFAEANSKEVQNLDIDLAKDILTQFIALGTRAVEITGFGDPTAYPHINELIDYAYSLGFSIGMNTNGHFAKNIINWQNFKWVRLSMNTLDFYSIKSAYPMDYIRQAAPNLQISGCYVWTSKGKKTIKKIIEFANKEKIPIRVVPNCIDTAKGIEKQIKLIKKLIPKDDPYVFCSDFNITTRKRKNYDCYLHLIKPALAPNGWIYSCPSSELSKENGTILKNEFRICKGKDVFSFYTSPAAFKIPIHNCSYCKYTEFNELLYNLLMKTGGNEFT